MADHHIENTLPVLLVDLLLLRISCYRHLLFNRGAPDSVRRREERYRTTLALGALVVALDACKFPFVLEFFIFLT